MENLTLMTVVIGALLPLASGQLRIIGQVIIPSNPPIFTQVPCRRVFYQECNGMQVDVYTVPSNILKSCEQVKPSLLISPPFSPICGGLVPGIGCTYHACDVQDIGTWTFFIQNPGGSLCDVNFDKATFESGNSVPNCDCP